MSVCPTIYANATPSVPQQKPSAHELAHLSCIAHAYMSGADELPPTAHLGETRVTYVAPITHPGKTCADELSFI